MLKVRLRSLRESAGLTLREAAIRLKKSPGYISRLEGRGEIPTAELICDMANLYGTDAEELLKLAGTAQLAQTKSEIEAKQKEALRLFRKIRKK